MTDTATIVKFPDPPPGEIREKRGPQVEDGYTRIANELYEVVNNAHACPVTLTQLRLIHAVIRRTFGFQKTMDSIADTQLAADTGIPRQKINPAKHALLAMRVLVLSEDGRKLGINKRYDEWDFSARPEKKPPQRHAQPDGDTVTKKVTESVTESGTHKRKKDMNTSTDVEERIGKPKRDASAAQGKPTKTLPDCPHMDILDQWSEVMPEKRQPLRSRWAGSARGAALKARWREGFKITHDQTGEPLYHDTASGIDWWGRFFKYLRKSEFLMRDDSRFFGIDWVVKSDNFEKILTKKYHGGDA